MIKVTPVHYSDCTCSEDFLLDDPMGHEPECPCSVESAQDDEQDEGQEAP